MTSRARLAAIPVIALIGLFSSTAPAWAARGVYASSCQEGHAGPYDVVASFQYYPTGSPVRLLCGTPAKGVLHIVQGAHPHPIDAADDDVFEQCLSRVFRSSVESGASPGNFAITAKLRSGARATVTWELSTREIVTAYTSDGAQGNNWRGCAAG